MTPATKESKAIKLIPKLAIKNNLYINNVPILLI